MSHRVELSARAEFDCDDSYIWYRDHYSPEYAIRWYNSLARALRSLEVKPHRCPLASESRQLPFELRELLLGRSKLNRHRILFKIVDDVVQVLHIRHSALDQFDPTDLLTDLGEPPQVGSG